MQTQVSTDSLQDLPKLDTSGFSIENISLYLEYAWPILTSVLIALVIRFIGWKLSDWASKLTLTALRKAKIDESLARFLSSLVRYAIIAITIVAILGQLGIETASLLALVLSAGLAIGLALQGSLANFASGVILLIYRPFQLADKVTVAGNFGIVENIGLFASVLKTLDNKTIIIPNSEITSDTITNYTRKGIQRAEIDVGVAYGSNWKEAEKTLLKAAGSIEEGLKEPAPGVAFVGLGASSLDFKVRTWCNCEDYLTVLHKLHGAVYDALNEQGIEIPFSQIVVHQAPEEEKKAV